MTININKQMQKMNALMEVLKATGKSVAYGDLLRVGIHRGVIDHAIKEWGATLITQPGDVTIITFKEVM
jgi:hypothetical protein